MFPNIDLFNGRSRDLYRILHTVKTISSYKSYRRLLKADDIKQQIFNCNQMVNHSRDIFLVCPS